MEVRAYHNVNEEGGRPTGYIDGYAIGDEVVLVFQADIEEPRPPVVLEDTYEESVDLAACEEVYRLLNVGNDPDFGRPDERAVAYRERRNRSLSMGDVVEVEGRFYACAAVGFTRLDEPPPVVVKRVHGTTPLHVPSTGG